MREISSTYASRPEIPLDLRSPLGFSLGFIAIEISLWRCTQLLPEVSPVFVSTESIVGDVSPTYASRPVLPLEMRSPRDFSL